MQDSEQSVPERIEANLRRDTELRRKIQTLKKERKNLLKVAARRDDQINEEIESLKAERPRLIDETRRLDMDGHDTEAA